MKKYVVYGILTGVAITIAILYFRGKKSKGLEFQDFVDSTSIADDLFGNAFNELPDKL